MSQTNVAAIIRTAGRTARLPRRHPAEVTSDRLGDAVTNWGDRLEPDELDMIARIRQALEEIADGTRRPA